MRVISFYGSVSSSSLVVIFISKKSVFAQTSKKKYLKAFVTVRKAISVNPFKKLKDVGETLHEEKNSNVAIIRFKRAGIARG